MRNLMLEDALQLQVHSSDAAYRDAKVCIIDRSRPGRRLRDVDEFFWVYRITMIFSEARSLVDWPGRGSPRREWRGVLLQVGDVVSPGVAG